MTSIALVEEWWDRYGDKTKKNKINEIINAINNLTITDININNDIIPSVSGLDIGSATNPFQDGYFAGNLEVGGYGNLGSLRIGGTEIITSGKVLQNLSGLSCSRSDGVDYAIEWFATGFTGDYTAVMEKLGEDSGNFGFSEYRVEGGVRKYIIGVREAYTWYRGLEIRSDLVQILRGTNISGNLEVNGDLTVATDKIRTAYPSSNDISVMAPNYLFLVGKNKEPFLTQNAYWNGSAWYRFNTSEDAFHVKVGYNKILAGAYAPSGTGAITWTEKFSIDKDGNLAIGGTLQFKDVSQYLWNFQTATNWGLYWDTSTNQLKWRGNGTDRMILDLDTGNLDVGGNGTFGSSSAGKLLTVWGSSGSRGIKLLVPSGTSVVSSLLTLNAYDCNAIENTFNIKYTADRAEFIQGAGDGSLRFYFTDLGGGYAHDGWYTFSPTLPDELEQLIAVLNQEAWKDNAPRKDGEIYNPNTGHKISEMSKEEREEFEEKYGKNTSLLSIGAARAIILLYDLLIKHKIIGA